ncbi:BCL2/adenovirus E1B 19 kDa protein-interacting protein 3-like [Cynoglossus semilaevis]|uniref:BCL2/adenovirus E1B 19 kDa protein-interacting protein 3-like n=1 Tax=Cynoglossus semilaevis TaxID=244447 RepID=UPI00049596C8|nr:BCL2/adenovirus E1B 19 kDa protein-interacting protein 3-like [Cynoglossus semilaevis]
MSGNTSVCALAAAAHNNKSGEVSFLLGSWVELELNVDTHTDLEQTPSADQMNDNTNQSETVEICEGIREDVENLIGGLEHVLSSSSIHNGDMEKILLDAQHESSPSNSSCQRPPSPDQDDGQITFDVEMPSRCPADLQMEDAGVDKENEEDFLINRATPLGCHWSSTPENTPPREFHFKHPQHSMNFSLRKCGVMQKGGIFSLEFFKPFIPCLCMSHILALGLGVYIGKRIATAATS